MLIITLLTIGVFALTPVLIEQSQSLTVELENVLDELEMSAKQEIDRLGIDLDVSDLFDGIEGFFSTGLSLDRVFAVVSATSRNLVWTLIVLVTTFYLLKDWHLFREWMIGLAPPGYQGDARRLYGEIRDVWQAYLWGQLVLMALIGVLSGLGSAAIGLQSSAVALGVIAGVLDLIPSVGPVVAMVIAMLVAWFAGAPGYLPVSNVVYVLIVLGVFTVIQAVENIWFRPRIMGQSLKMHPALVFVGVTGGIAIGGILVGLLIVPLMGTVSVIGAYLRARMFGLDPWRPDPMSIPPPVSARNGLEPGYVEGIEYVQPAEPSEENDE